MSKANKKLLSRKPNPEENGFWFLNMCYCFFFPFACRTKPITDEDIPVSDSRDGSSINVEKVKDVWIEKVKAYSAEMKVYEENRKKEANPSVKTPKKPMLFFLIMRKLVSPSFVWGYFLMLLNTAIKTIEPFLMRLLLKVLVKKMLAEEFPDDFKTPNFPYTYGIILSLCPFLEGFTEAWACRAFYHFIGRFRAILCALIYKKTYSLNIAANSSDNAGRILALISSDCQQAQNSLYSFLEALWLPFKVLAPLVFCFVDFGVITFMVFATVLVLFPFQAIVFSILFSAMGTYFMSNDDRSKITNEVLQGVRIIKFSGLEKVFQDRIAVPRKIQVNAASTVCMCFQQFLALMNTMPLFVNVACFSVYVYANHIPQEDFIVKVVPTLTFITTLTLNISMVAVGLGGISQSVVIVNRIRDFLVLPETTPYIISTAAQSPTPLASTASVFVVGQSAASATDEAAIAVKVKDCTFLWGAPPDIPVTAQEQEKKEQDEQIASYREKQRKKQEREKEKENNKINSKTKKITPMEEKEEKEKEEGKEEKEKEKKNAPKKKVVLKDISFDVPAGSLTLIIGPVGCGKSSVCSALVGDMELAQGATDLEGVEDVVKNEGEEGEKEEKEKEKVVVRKGEVHVEGRVAYCPQVAWIANCTVKENILFGLPYNAARYDEAVRVCCLQPDFSILPAGDGTAIGEKGVNLSGGQKARIQLARAVYSDSDVYVLDDPLSAVDAHVGKALFDTCIADTGMLRGKTRVLITNQLQYLPHADKVILLSNGRIRAQGSFADLKANGISFSGLLRKKAGAGDSGKGKKNGQEKKTEREEEKEKEKELEKEKEKEKRAKEVSEWMFNDEGEIEVEMDDAPVNTSSTGMSAPTPLQGTTAAFSSESSISSFFSSRPALSPATPTISTPTPTPSLEETAASNAAPNAAVTNSNAAAEKIMTEEEQATGGVTPSTYVRYFLTLVPAPLLPLLFVVYAIPNVLITFAGYWSGKIGVVNEFTSISFGWKILIYLFFGIGVYVFFVVVSVVSKIVVIRSDTLIHNALLVHIMHCPVSFFDTTPIGRIINRFTGDMTNSDIDIYFVLVMVINIVFTLLGDVIVVGIDTPWYFVIGLPILALYFILLIVGSRASQNLQRLQAISHSPVISHFSELITGAGLTSVRTYGQEKTWEKKFYELNDQWTLLFVLYFESQKFSALLASMVSSLFMLSIVLIGWFTLNTANFSIALTSAISFSAYGSVFVEQLSSVNSAMTSFERIRFYSSNLPQELEHNDVVPDENWPRNGSVKFNNVSFRYRPGLPYVLKNVSFDVRGSERIGVCGRTGSGKTSLIYALFRFVELDPALQPALIDTETGFLAKSAYDEPPNQGSVLIDGVDISRIALNVLRKSVAIIPQDPTLFTGTVRSNIDLAGRYRKDGRNTITKTTNSGTGDDENKDEDRGERDGNDADLWEVLDMVQMREAVAALPQGLDSAVTEGGANFSCGQRQLLCFARALLNKCRIVVMDEATANVDMETDALIQKTIATQFKKQTIIIIAHRLHTILNSDRILVMSDGHVAEFDTPAVLQANSQSAFSGLLHSLNE